MSSLKLIEDKSNNIFVSAVSIWEISIKSSLSKLTVPTNFFDLVFTDFLELQVSWMHAREVAYLENIHQDPFDRLLIAQSRINGFTLLTKDKNIMKYDLLFIEA